MDDLSVETQMTPDAACAAASGLAREALVSDVLATDVGEHVSVVAEADRVATHLFDCGRAGYIGWRWAVTVSRTPDSDVVTVDEVTLLPGPDAVVAPEWVPWRDRIASGDLGPGDLLPTEEGDPRVVPGYTGADDDPHREELVPHLWELGLGRNRVMSFEGRADAAHRWRSGESGPSDKSAKWAPEQCSTCAYVVALSGPLHQEFGVCGNEFSPSDGHVVTFDHGCGAHSETPPAPPIAPVTDLVIDDGAVESMDLAAEPT